MATRRVVQVYLDLLSQPCRAVHILLNCNKIPHTVRTVALRKGELLAGWLVNQQTNWLVNQQTNWLVNQQTN